MVQVLARGAQRVGDGPDDRLRPGVVLLDGCSHADSSCQVRAGRPASSTDDFLMPPPRRRQPREVSDDLHRRRGYRYRTGSPTSGFLSSASTFAGSFAFSASTIAWLPA